MSDAGIRQGLDELESRLAFQDELLEQLSDIVARQDREILELKRLVAELAGRLKDIGESMPEESPGPEHEVPPHY